MTADAWAIIVPTYGHYDYALRTCVSAFRADPACVLLVVDDATPNWPHVPHWSELESWFRSLPSGRRYFYRFPKHGGLTRSWNQGLRMARELGCAVACAANSDLIFSSTWKRALEIALAGGWGLVGPVTNAPGTAPEQNVRRYRPAYRPTDQQDEVDACGESLWNQYQGHCFASTLNGFCLVARTETWWAHAWSSTCVFKPRNDFDAQGTPNPTPLMTLNEYELQRRWHKAGLRTGHCPGSFVFHYRSVSRGGRYAGRYAYRRRVDGSSGSVRAI